MGYVIWDGVSQSSGGGGGTPVDAYTKAETIALIDSNILYYVPRIFWSFYVNAGALVFDNLTNTIPDKALLICTKGGTVGAITYTKGFLYQINKSTNSPVQADIVEFLTLQNGKSKNYNLSRDFNDDVKVVYVEGVYKIKLDNSDIELIAPAKYVDDSIYKLHSESIITIDWTVLTPDGNGIKTYTILENTISTAKTYYINSTHDANDIIIIPAYSQALEGKKLLFDNYGSFDLHVGTSANAQDLRGIRSPAVAGYVPLTDFVRLEVEYKNGDIQYL